MAGAHVALADSKRPRKQDVVRVGEVDADSRVEVTLTLRPEHFARDSKKVKEVLGRVGLADDAEFPATGSLVMSGTAAQIEKAFRAGLGMYSHREDGVLRGREGELSIPADLDGLITVCSGSISAGSRDGWRGQPRHRWAPAPELTDPIRSAPPTSRGATASPTEIAQARRSRGRVRGRLLPR